MAITVAEKALSRPSKDGDNPSVELLYTIQGTDSDIDAKAALAGAVPAMYGGLVLTDYSVDPLGGGLWDGTANYGKYPQAGESVISFDTGGGTSHITQSKQAINRYPSTAPDFKGAIGVTADSVEGVDVTTPIYHLSVTKYLPNSAVNLTYEGILFNLTGKVNSDAFRGMQPGECLFLGASGSRRGNNASDFWEITYKFAGSPNKTDLVVGDITGIAKDGWDYLWVRYQDDTDDTAKAHIKKPAAVYIERVYDRAAFAPLGL